MESAQPRPLEALLLVALRQLTFVPAPSNAPRVQPQLRAAEAGKDRGFGWFLLGKKNMENPWCPEETTQ